MNNKNLKHQSLEVKGNGLPTVKSDFYASVDEANKRISEAINKNRIEEGDSIEKARAFVTNI